MAGDIYLSTGNALQSAASVATPSWISSLSTASIATDMSAAIIDGVVTESGLAKLLHDLDATLSPTLTLAANEFADLQTIAANLGNGVTTSGYLSYVFDALVNGNPGNATWTGGEASSVTLGDLAVGATETQLSELIGKWFSGTDLPSSYVDMTESGGGQPFTINHSAVNSPLFGPSGPSVDDVNQGDLGDCFFLAACGAVACEDPSQISSMFTSNGDGTYGVRFYYNGSPEYVTVNTELANGGAQFNHGTDIWASLAEKAYAQLQSINLSTGNSSVDHGNSYSTIGNGGWPVYSLEALTGATILHSFEASGSTWSDYTMNASVVGTNYVSGETTDAVLQAIVSDLAAHDDVIVDSNTATHDPSGNDMLVPDHSFVVYGYDSMTGMLELRNPWGTEPWQYWDTTFEVSLGTLLANGDEVITDNAGKSHIPDYILAIHANDIAHSGDVTGSYNFIDLPNLEASYGDLINAFGINQQEMQNWYNSRETIEHRPDTFDGLDYVASYGDLIDAFKNAGSEQAMLDDGAMHFIQYGYHEGRTTSFNGLDYIASYGDLIHAFGVNGDAGATHYIEYGVNEGRTTTFDGLDYIASYKDLINAFGANEQAGAEHFIQYGNHEGRSTSFDGLDYIAGYTDLMNAFGANGDAGATHYINHGLNEGRSADPFNVAAYESAHPDLIGQYANDDAFLAAYIDNYKMTGTFLT